MKQKKKTVPAVPKASFKKPRRRQDPPADKPPTRNKRAVRVRQSRSMNKRALLSTERVARTPAQAMAITAEIQSAAVGADIMEQIMDGSTMVEVTRRTGFSSSKIRKMLASFQCYHPEEHKSLADGMRDFMGGIAFDDMLHWRPRSRKPELVTVVTKDGQAVQVRDIETQKYAGSQYKSAKDDTIRIYGLHTQTVEITQGTTAEPLSAEALAVKAQRVPEVEAAARAIGLLPPLPGKSEGKRGK